VRSGYTLSEIVAALLILALAALAFFGILSDALSGVSRVHFELEKTFEANAQLEKYFSGALANVITQTSILTINATGLATSLKETVTVVKPDPREFTKTPLLIFEPTP